MRDEEEREDKPRKVRHMVSTCAECRSTKDLKTFTRFISKPTVKETVSLCPRCAKEWASFIK